MSTTVTVSVPVTETVTAGAVPRETLGDLLRALGQNPTQAEVADIVASAPREGTSVSTDFDGEVLITT